MQSKHVIFFHCISPTIYFLSLSLLPSLSTSLSLLSSHYSLAPTRTQTRTEPRAPIGQYTHRTTSSYWPVHAGQTRTQTRTEPRAPIGQCTRRSNTHRITSSHWSVQAPNTYRNYNNKILCSRFLNDTTITF